MVNEWDGRTGVKVTILKVERDSQLKGNVVIFIIEIYSLRPAGVPPPRLLQPLLQVRQRHPHPRDLRQRTPLQH